MSFFGYHLQTPVDEWDSEILWAAEERRPFKLVKGFWVEIGKTVKHISPSTTTIFRHWIQHQEPFLDRALISPAEADAAADDFISRFADSVNYHSNIDYVESLNETYAAQNPLNQAKAVAFDRAFIRRLQAHCPSVRPIVYTAASGNIEHDEWGVLVNLARECEAADGAFGYHNYWSVVNGNSFAGSRQHAMDYHMRWAWSLDPYLKSRGINVKYMLGESGPISAESSGYWQKPDDGWLNHNCWAGSIDGYKSDLIIMDNLMYASIPAKEGRLIGAVLFTSGYHGWEHFQVRQPMLGHVANHVVNYEGEPLPQPPIDPPVSDFEQRAWAVTVEMQQNGDNAIRLNAEAGIQQAISEDNLYYGTDFQIVTAETGVDGRTVQAAESLSDQHDRRVYVYEPGEEIYYFEHP